jgi:hypothetical protein
MPLDHYVSQVHLKNFSSPALEGLIYAVRKSDLKRFKTRPQDICRIADGDTNEYLREKRAVEEFLQDVEPQYNSSLDKLRNNKIDGDCIFCIAGFIAYVITCSPAAMRIHSGPLQKILESTAAILDKQGALPKSPDILGNKTLSELLAEGTVKFDVDPKYPQAMGVSAIKHHVSVFGNSRWEILLNSHVWGNPFFTSDYPVAIETFDINTPINRIVPLAPDIAVRIKPDIRLSRAEPDLTFAKFSSTQIDLKRQDILEMNRLFVRCAEDLVLYRDEYDWVENFIRKNRGYKVEPVTEKITLGLKELLVSTHRIKETVAAKS